jgi:hypothetical protein
MGQVEHEHLPLTVSKTVISQDGGAKSDARRAPETPQDSDPDIAVKALPELPKLWE